VKYSLGTVRSKLYESGKRVVVKGTYEILGDEVSHDPSFNSVAWAGGKGLEVFLELGFSLRRRGFGREFSLLLEVKEKKKVNCK